jgi:MoaA/NifB/PqqE/SkfB family radical SAM enzyme
MGSLGVDRVVFNNLIYATKVQVKSQAAIMKENFGITYTGGNPQSNHYSQVDTELINQEFFSIRAGAYTSKVFIMPPGVEQNLHAYYDPQNTPFPHQECVAIYRELWILPNGDVAACGKFTELTMGNIHQKKVMEIWNDSPF